VRSQQAAALELALVRRAQHGVPKAREQLVESFLPLIALVAQAYRRSTAVDRAELMQEGVVGLLRALERFDPERGVPFWGYAAWWVRQAMQQLVSELSRPMVLSDRALRQLARVRDAERRYEQTRQAKASTADLAAMLDIPRSQIERLLCAAHAARGLDEPASGEPGDGRTLGDLVAHPPAEEAFARLPERLLAADVPALLAQLSERERLVLCCRYGIGRPVLRLREVAPLLGVTAERVRQIEKESLTKLRVVVAESPPAAADAGRPGDRAHRAARQRPRTGSTRPVVERLRHNGPAAQPAP
jgi:RNA polymerase sigma factor (sigma-70 family)